MFTCARCCAALHGCYAQGLDPFMFVYDTLNSDCDSFAPRPTNVVDDVAGCPYGSFLLTFDAPPGTAALMISGFDGKVRAKDPCACLCMCVCVRACCTPSGHGLHP